MTDNGQPYPRWFDIGFGHPITTETWEVDEDRSEPDKACYTGYDTNLWKLRPFEEWPAEAQAQTRAKALERLEGIALRDMARRCEDRRLVRAEGGRSG